VPGDRFMDIRRTFIKRAGTLAFSSGFLSTLTLYSDLLFGEKEGINIIVENHGGYSGDPCWHQSHKASFNRKR